jgi:hypothetical protein
MGCPVLAVRFRCFRPPPFFDHVFGRHVNYGWPFLRDGCTVFHGDISPVSAFTVA